MVVFLFGCWADAAGVVMARITMRLISRVHGQSQLKCTVVQFQKVKKI